MVRGTGGLLGILFATVMTVIFGSRLMPEGDPHAGAAPFVAIAVGLFMLVCLWNPKPRG